MRLKLIASVTAALLVAPTSLAAPGRWLIPPVDAPIRRGFDLPEGVYGPGNRGIDYSASPGQGVRAAEDGVVAFAGPVAGPLAVTIDHGEGMETTYTGLREVHVEAGRLVAQGAWIGEAGDRGLHFGVLVGDVYVDPVDYLGPVDQTDAIHLVPVRSRAEEGAHGEDGRRCTPRAELQKLRHTRAPSNNVAVVVAGINDSWSRDRRPRAFEVPAALGYERVAYFSYSGRPDGYSKADTRG
ncbi:MAG: murein hydrolase activator EnvC family protein, partial [Actinomycetota bacterium]